MKNFEFFLQQTKEIGRVVAFHHFIAFVEGLPNLKLGEMVVTKDNQYGLTIGMEANRAEILMINALNLKGGDEIVRSGIPFSIPVGEALLGRVINPLSQPVDGLGPLAGDKEYRSIWREAPNITKRIKVRRFMETGVLVVDTLIPIGYGQRELVIGDRKTGKTQFLRQVVTNQSRKGKICVYTAIGKNRADLKTTEKYLKSWASMENVIIVATFADDPSPLIYLTPYAGVTIAEFFRDLGNDVILVLDDMTTHAKIYREISLLLGRLPGRNAYPGDIFHIHAEIMERTGNIRLINGEEASITALPVAQTLENDLSGYIQTNLMAMTDGHIFFDSRELQKGKFPPINTFLSVSRVGNQTKNQLERELADFVRKQLIEYQQAQKVATFGTELPQKTQEIIQLGEKL